MIAHQNKAPCQNAGRIRSAALQTGHEGAHREKPSGAHSMCAEMINGILKLLPVASVSIRHAASADACATSKTVWLFLPFLFFCSSLFCFVRTARSVVRFAAQQSNPQPSR